jgi:hypothetical protein
MYRPSFPEAPTTHTLIASSPGYPISAIPEITSQIDHST